MWRSAGDEVAELVAVIPDVVHLVEPPRIAVVVSGPIDLDDNGDPRGFYQVYTVRDHSYEFGDFVTS